MLTISIENAAAHLGRSVDEIEEAIHGFGFLAGPRVNAQLYALLVDKFGTTEVEPESSLATACQSFESICRCEL